MVTGQVVLRDAGPAPTKDGRKLLMIVGVIAVPSDFEFLGEHQYTLSGSADGDMRLHIESEKDVTALARGHSLGGLLTEPMWRC